VQVRLVNDLGDHLNAPIFDREAPDQRLECAVLAVMPEVGPEDVGPHPLQLAPYADPMPSRHGRERRQERQPAHLAPSVTSATLGRNRYVEEAAGPSSAPR
jgi:hypothetical protein